MYVIQSTPTIFTLHGYLSTSFIVFFLKTKVRVKPVIRMRKGTNWPPPYRVLHTFQDHIHMYFQIQIDHRPMFSCFSLDSHVITFTCDANIWVGLYMYRQCLFTGVMLLLTSLFTNMTESHRSISYVTSSMSIAAAESYRCFEATIVVIVFIEQLEKYDLPISPV